MSSTDPPVFVLYRYEPSLPAAIIFVILFLIAAFFHTYQMIRTKTWFYTALIVGGHMEWIGYVGRAIGSKEAPNYTLGPYILQSVLLLVAPALFAATIYMTLGRIVRICNGERHLLIRINWLTKLFVWGDVFSFFIQAAGAGLMSAGSASMLDIGQKIIIVGLVLQIVFFMIFVVVAATFHVRMAKDTRRWTSATEFPWVKHMVTLYLASTIILIRSIYRVIEYSEGLTGYLMSNEWFIYVFDGMLMLIVLIIFNVMHGSVLNQYLKGNTRTRIQDLESSSLRSVGSK